MFNRRPHKVITISVVIYSLLTFSSWSAPPEIQSEFGEFRVLLHNGEKINGFQGVLTTWDVRGLTELGDSVICPFQDITSLEIANGNHATTGLLFGMLFGFCASTIAVYVINEDPSNNIDTGEIAMSIGISTAIFGVAGAAIGALLVRWERIPLPRDIGFVAKASSQGEEY